MKQYPEIIEIIPEKDRLRFDVMLGDTFGGQVVLNVTPRVRYGYGELEAFARIARPSLANKKFRIIPTSNAVFRN
jgi:hypothetical protein